MDQDAKLLKEAYSKVDEGRFSPIEREQNPFGYWWDGYMRRQNLKGHPELKLLKQVAADAWVGSSTTFRPDWG